MPIRPLLLAISLSAPANATELDTVPASYEQMLAEVEALNEAINAGEPVRDRLFDALAKFPRHAPLLAADPAARAIRARAQLNLARTYLAEGAHESAAGVMDEILRSTKGEALPVAEYGPSLAALYQQRRAALERAGTAAIDVRCHVPCRVYINERATRPRADDLYLGIYRVWIEPIHSVGTVGPNGPSGDSRDFQNEWVKLSQPGQTVILDFRRPEPAESVGHRRERVMPRAAEIALLVAGASAVSVGSLTLGLADGARGRRIAGATLTGLGGAALLIGGITLSVDEVRIGQAHGHQAMLAWQVTF